ncbi:MAG: polysaccharide biosynthesis C-terminal domain-containing protein [Mucilaginibacter sp.]|uniref:oligosaccharide flippase family protein n=1 Tax=Mucilaginibacter sp. TaxID=1882438 RepID=UPI0031B3C87C
MNLLQKQGFLNTLILYGGVALGFVNGVFLFQRFLTLEQIGFFQLMLTISLLYAQIAALGISNIILKYFPYYRSEDKAHGGFATFAALWTLLGFTVFTLLIYCFREPLLSHYSKSKGGTLLVKYAYFIIPLSFLTMAYATLESMASTVFKNVLSSFLREIGLRMFTLISILLLAITAISYHDFLLIYIIANICIIVVLLIYIARGKHFKLSRISPRLLTDKAKFFNYGFYTVLSGSSYVLIQNLDNIMLSLLTKQSLAYVGVYATFFSIAVVISLPAKALSRTSLQIIAQSWAENDLAKIGKIYHKTSVVQMLIGCLLFIGLVSNKLFIITLLHKPEYAGFFGVFVVVGLGFLVDMTGGVNGYIMNFSKYYRLTTVFIVVAVIACGVLNWLLIPRLGMMGAAVAYVLTIFLLNLAYTLFVKIKFGLQPFGREHLWVLLMSTGCLLIGLYLPAINNVYIDMVYRSIIIGIIYAAMAYFLKISADINVIFDRILKKKEPGANV